jgi:hypothetical protein
MIDINMRFHIGDQFDVDSLLLLLVLVAASCILHARDWRLPGMLMTACCIAVVTAIFARGFVLDPRIWPLILATYDESSGGIKVRRREDIQRHWHSVGMTAIDWFSLSSKWNVCHKLWPQDNCHLPAGPFDADGIAREILENVASGRDNRGKTLEGLEREYRARYRGTRR